MTASLEFVGVARTSWQPGNCPKNMREAKERACPAELQIEPSYRGALVGLDRASHVILLGWFDRASRDRLIQQPKHLASPIGAFALRTPDRPNPIALSVARLIAVDIDDGRLMLEALDWLGGTPVLDIKPYYPSVDCEPDARVREDRA